MPDIIFFLVFVLFILMVIALINKLCHQQEDEVLYFPKQEEEELPPLNFPVNKIKKQNEEKQTAASLEQQRLITQYANSELTKQILNYVCNGNYKLYQPREIFINHDNIKSDVLGKLIVFDFVSNRVPTFDLIHNLQEYVLAKPQVAFAEAINQLMGNEYEIIDRGERILEEKHYHDGESKLLIYYKSNYVQMRLKATKQF